MSGDGAKRGTNASPVLVLRGERGEEIVDVLCASFHDYPVMRYVVGDAGDDYDRRLRVLVGMFASARLLQRHPIYAIEDAGRIVSVGTTTPPGSHKRPPEFQAMRDEAWRALGADAEARYETLIAAWESGSFPEPCHHVNMLGTLRSHAGRGYGRRILDTVQEASRHDPPTLGVSLSTEDPKNVPLYEYCGYRVVHHARVTDALETWLLFRDNNTGGGDAAPGTPA